MFTFDSKHTRSRYKIRAQQQQETFGVVNRRQFGANYIPMISFHSQAAHVQHERFILGLPDPLEARAITLQR